MIRMAIRLLHSKKVEEGGSVDDPWMAWQRVRLPPAAPNGRGPASQPVSQSASPAVQLRSNSFCSAVERRRPQGHGEWLEAQTQMSRCRIALRPCSTAISWEACRSAHRLPAGDWTPRGPQGALESGPETMRYGLLGSLTKGGLLDARQFAPKPHDHPATPTLGRRAGRGGAISTCSCQRSSHPVDVDPASQLPGATNHGLAEQLSIEHSPTATHLSSSTVWQWVELRTTSFGNSSDPELSGGGGCRSNKIWNMGVRFCDLSRLDIVDRDAQLQHLRKASLSSFSREALRRLRCSGSARVYYLDSWKPSSGPGVFRVTLPFRQWDTTDNLKPAGTTHVPGFEADFTVARYRSTTCLSVDRILASWPDSSQWRLPGKRGWNNRLW
jgi:hypothetical protein